ncbi:MAG: YerC/YecD family TrpR-related protein [bacterium]|nr:YerC/YecD family TrpR-related protein [bacterium]
MQKWDNQNTRNLITTLLLLKNEAEMKRFLRDLLTENEIIEFGKRWQAAQLLNETVPYTDIIQKTGLSSTTVARISKWLRHGRGGYRLALKKIHGHHVNVKSGASP